MGSSDPWKDFFSAMKEEDWNEAIKNVDTLIKKEPTDPEHFVRLGDLHLKEEKRGAAISAYKKAVSLYGKMNLKSKAILTCKKILTLDPDNTETRKELRALLKDHEATGSFRIDRLSATGETKKSKTVNSPKETSSLMDSEKMPEFLREILNTEFRKILDNLESVKFRPNDTIIREGDTGDSLFIILKGTVEVSSMIHGKKVSLAQLSEGEIFGEMAFLTSKPRSATVTAVTEVNLIELSKPTLDKIVEPKPHILRYLYNIYTSRMDVTLSKLKQSGDSLSGNISELPLSDILQVLEQSRKEGVLFINADGREGTISFKDGFIMDAALAGLSGEDAVVEILSLSEGKFNYAPQKVSPGKITKPVNFVLMESIRLIDEKSELSDYVPREDSMLALQSFPSLDNEDIQAVVNTIQEGASKLHDICEDSDLSRIRTTVAVAKLIKDGFLKVEASH